MSDIDIARWNADQKLEAIESIIRDYHFALDTRQHGGVAAHRAIEAIMAAINMPWIMHAELRRRERKPAPVIES